MFNKIIFFVGFATVIIGCLAADSEDDKALETCASKNNVSQSDLGFTMFYTVLSDDYEFVSTPENICLVDCVARESGFLTADDEFDPSKLDSENLKYCATTIENWKLWDRANKCQKGYLFFKCKSYGKTIFPDYISIQERLASGELKPKGSGNDSNDEDW